MQRISARLRRAAAAWINAESGRLILFLPVCMDAGIMAYFGWPGEPGAIPPLGMAAILVPACVLLRAWPIPQAAMLGAVFAVIGFASAQRATRASLPWAELPRHAAIVSGRIASLDMLPDGRRVTLDGPTLDRAPPLARQLRLRLRNTDDQALSPGDVIRVRALLRPPAPPAYPGAWDTQRDAYFAGLAGYGFAIGPVARLAAGPDGAWRHLRTTIAARIMASLPGARGAIAATLLTGLGSAIPAPDRAAFQNSGLAHLLAVAGLHIGIVMGLVFVTVRRALSLSERVTLHLPIRQIAALTALAAGLFYLVLTGAHVPILRSFTMACLVALAIVTGRRAMSLRALALAATLIMLAAPELVVGVSFQMSFCAVLALIAGWEALSPHLAKLRQPGWWRGPARHAAGLIATSALAGTASLPIAAYHFGTITPYYIPANLLAVPITAFWVMPWGLAALALMPLGLHGLALVPMGWGIALLLALAHGVAGWPGASLPVPQMPALALALATMGLIILCVLRTRARLLGTAVMAAGLVWAALAPLPDLIVSPDARLVAARADGAIYVSAAGVSRFDRQTPARIWGGAPELPFPMSGGTADGALSCTPASCLLTLRRSSARLVWQQAGECDGASVAVAHIRLTCQAPLIVDRASTAADGATAIQMTADGPVAQSDATMRGVRPWVLRDDVAPVRLPPAMTE